MTTDKQRQQMRRLTREQVEQMLAAGERDFRNCDLSGLDLSGLDLRRCDLDGVDMSWVSTTTDPALLGLTPTETPEKE